jgi:8-oxo-dGTP pyrophosphatase MutT (NUDIX family)
MLTGPFANSLLPQRVRRLFGGRECRLQVAALPWRRSEHGVEVMLITSRDTGRWVLPKGWPEEGEALHEAAAREAFEEAGISGGIASAETGSYFYNKIRSSGTESLCEVHVFPLEVRETASKWREKGQRKRKWVTPREAIRMVNEPDLGRLITRFCGGFSTERSRAPSGA